MWRITPKFDLQTLLILAFMNVLALEQEKDPGLKAQREMTSYWQPLACHHGSAGTAADNL
jgi:hypothetical protein